MSTRNLQVNLRNSYGEIKRNITKDYILATTAKKLVGNFTNASTNTIGALNYWGRILYGATGFADWAMSTPPTITANSWLPLGYLSQAGLGFLNYIQKIEVIVDRDCSIALSDNIGSNLTESFRDLVKHQKDPTGGTVVFDFSDNPLIMNSQSICQLFFSRNSTTGINFNVQVYGYKITSNLNFEEADFELGIMGDSFCGYQEATALIEYKKTGSTVIGTFPIIIEKYLKSNGINVIRTHHFQGGSNLGYYESIVNFGLFSRWRPDILVCHLGINNGVSDITSLGAYNSMKNIITQYFTEIPKGCFVLMNVEDTDIASKLSIVGSGVHSGKTFLAAIRDTYTDLVAELKADNPTWDLQIAQTIPANTYTSSQLSYYGETAVGTRLHPNTTLGQLAIANVVNTTIATTNFFNKYKR